MEDRFRNLLELDLTDVFWLCRAVGRHMIAAGRGSIVNVASLVGLRALDRYPLSAYSAAKSGLVGLNPEPRRRMGGRGVRVNALCPAFFSTRLTEFFADPDQVAWIVHRTPLGRVPRPGELDGPLLFLASDASSYVTGQNPVVDGGWTVY